ncbi:4Fe-4S ferredoxin [Candidatus Geothermarchaeota archaeon]|nr:MAG: 4Fe-4S ferredoxin [Candidatus Geothermarchaeota archaeon]
MMISVKGEDGKPILGFNQEFIDELIELGGEDLLICYQCGSCTAICPLSEVFNISFRKTIKYAQLGLEEKLLKDTTPWLCYACGECSDTCPRNAKPTNILAAIRRYLTIKYDWTGLSRALYFSKKAEVAGISILAALTGLIIYLFHGPMVLERVELETFAPIHIVEPAGIITLVVLAGFLLSNIYRMYKFIMSDAYPGVKIPLSMYIKEFIKIIPTHFLTQRLMNKCRERKSYWYTHLLIFYGYALAFILFAVVLRYTQTNLPFLFVDPVSIFGILSFIFLLIGSSLAIYGRIRKTQPIWSFSHSTDWMFITLLLLVSLTGLLTGIFRTINWPLPTYIIYSIHLMLVVPFLALEVPFAKWSHLAYRPFAIYFHRLRELTYELAPVKEARRELIAQPITGGGG